MKKIVFLLCLLFTMGVQAQLWENSFDSALSKANSEDKPIVLVFSGSDWCGPCMRFKKKVLDSEEFTYYAAQNYVLYNADFPRKTKNALPQEKLNANKSLAEKYNPKGYFPMVVVLDKNESVLGKTGFDKRKTPSKYIDLFNGYVK